MGIVDWRVPARSRLFPNSGLGTQLFGKLRLPVFRCREEGLHVLFLCWKMSGSAVYARPIGGKPELP